MSADVSEAIPHRKVIRSWLEPFRVSRTAYAVGVLVFDFTVLIGLISLTVVVEHWAAKILFGGLVGLMISRLFVLGHDACHQSLTKHKKLNKWLGRIAMLPSLSPFSLWQVGHNVVHHGYTNLKGVDFVWAPMTLAEYQSCSPVRRRLERIYRSGWGSGLYYLIEVWWLRMYFPNKRHIKVRRAEFIWDNLLVTFVAIIWLAILAWASHVLGQSFWLVFATAFVLPLAIWFTVIGFVVYVHHTHRDVSWYDDKLAWGASAPFVSTTVHMQFPFGIGKFLHNIMDHTAHHVDMGIPMYTLPQAQAEIETALPDQVTVQDFSFRWYFQTARSCQLYDFEHGGWTDFHGRPT